MKEEQAESFLSALEELIDAKVSDAISSSQASPDDSMAGFGNFGRLEEAKKRVLRALTDE